MKVRNVDGFVIIDIFNTSDIEVDCNDTIDFVADMVWRSNIIIR